MTFSLSLRLWQRWSQRWPLKHLIALTFFLEIALVFTVGLFTTVPGMALFSTEQTTTASLMAAALSIGIFNGLYNAFFWTTQRALFLRQLGQNDTGRQYGNFQIFVTLFLKAGILLGGVLLDTGGFIWVLALSAGVSGVSSLWLAQSKYASQPLLKQATPVGSHQSLTYKDKRGSRSTFAIDGIFLYLESHFWTLSLFLIVDEDFTNLGIAVVLLALVFAVLFYLIKNGIDGLPIENVFRAAVVLYAFSWLLRFTLDNESQGMGLLVTLVVITFFSTFFRLAFNKRFFDVARQEGAVHYLLFKSYSSQWVLGLCFLFCGTLLYMIPLEAQVVLQFTYVFAAILSLLYLRYNDKQLTV